MTEDIRDITAAIEVMDRNVTRVLQNYMDTNTRLMVYFLTDKDGGHTDLIKAISRDLDDITQAFLNYASMVQRLSRFHIDVLDDIVNAAVVDETEDFNAT